VGDDDIDARAANGTASSRAIELIGAIAAGGAAFTVTGALIVGAGATSCTTSPSKSSNSSFSSLAELRLGATIIAIWTIVASRATDAGVGTIGHEVITERLPVVVQRVGASGVIFAAGS
jgi:hypothetical protein